MSFCLIRSLYEVRPAAKDLGDHISLISEAVKRDDSLVECKVCYPCNESLTMSSTMSVKLRLKIQAVCACVPSILQAMI